MPKATNKDREEAVRISHLLQLARTSSPPWLAGALVKAKPAVAALSSLVNVLAPFVALAWTRGKEIYRVAPTHLLSAAYGLALCFFGGQYMVAVAAIEAFNECGGEEMWTCVQDLSTDYQLLRAASAHDDTLDENNDGVLDTSVLSHSALASRKTLLALRTVNPDRVSQAVTGLVMGVLAVLMTLKAEFTKTVALGVSIGE